MAANETQSEQQVQLRCHALTYAVEAWRDHRDFPHRGQDDDRTDRIVATAEKFAAFLNANPT